MIAARKNDDSPITVTIGVDVDKLVDKFFDFFSSGGGSTSPEDDEEMSRGR